MDSLLIDNTYNDLLVDLSGNIAVTKNPYQLAQSVACAVRMFRGECKYDVTLGIPYFDTVLGKLPSQNTVNSLIRAEAETVRDVINIAVSTGLTTGNRTSYGIIAFNDATTGEEVTVTI